MQLDGGLIVQVVAMLIAAGAIYGGIRSDIKAIHAHLRRIEGVANTAHRRIDRCVYGRRAGDVGEAVYEKDLEDDSDPI